MAKGFKYGAGGGTSLNFKVVGNPQPSNPVENTVWIDTDTPITSYIFSAVQPTGEEGMVWIATGTTSTVKFNALKKNGITVQILSASQYVSGAWVSKTAKIYQNSAWVGFELYLYDAGNTFADITGGWVGYAKSQTSDSGNASKPTAKYNTDNVVITCSEDSGWGSGMWCTKNKITLTEKSKLVFDGLLNKKIAYLAVWSAIGTYTKDNLVSEAQITKTSRATVNLDVSSLSGSYYVGLRFQGSQTDPQVTMFSLKAM